MKQLKPKIFMKRILLLSLITICFGASSQAQIYYNGRPVRLGFKVEPVFPNTLKPFDNGTVKDGSGIGINYGLMADILFNDARGAFATGLEVQHARSSFSTTEVDRGLYGKGDYDLRLQYLQIPLSVKLKSNMINGVRWWGQFGTYVDALLGARLDYAAALGKGSNERVMKQTNKVNIGLLIGMGGEYNLSYKTDAYFGLGFENGFTDITSNGKWKDGKVTLNRWALHLGMFF